MKRACSSSPRNTARGRLFTRVLKSEPDNTAAARASTKVADDLVRRGETALDQGRFDDARATVERIRAALPDHAGAKALAQKIFPATATRGEPARRRRRSARVPEAAARGRASNRACAAAEAAGRSARRGQRKAFDKALAEGRLLTPAEQSAKHFVGPA